MKVKHKAQGWHSQLDKLKQKIVTSLHQPDPHAPNESAVRGAPSARPPSGGDRAMPSGHIPGCWPKRCIIVILQACAQPTAAPRSCYARTHCFPALRVEVFATTEQGVVRLATTAVRAWEL